MAADGLRFICEAYFFNAEKIGQHFPTELPAVFLALKRKETPMIAKVFAVITVGCALSPIDLIPDFIPVLGYLDDVILLPAFVALTIKYIPNNVFEECRKESENMWADGKHKKGEVFYGRVI